MTHSGSVVVLPHDLRVPFIKHIALSGIQSMRRYSVGRVYREQKVFNFHPKQLYECAFDIITPYSTTEFSKHAQINPNPCGKNLFLIFHFSFTIPNHP